MNVENRYRGLCEWCTAFSFTCFYMIFKEESGGYFGAYVGAAVAALVSWLSNCESDKSSAERGIQYSKKQLSSKLFIAISLIRYYVEKISAGLLGMLLVMYLITNSYEKEIFASLAYYEIKVMILGIMLVSYFLLLSSIMLLFVQRGALGNNSMKRMLQ